MSQFGPAAPVSTALSRAASRDGSRSRQPEGRPISLRNWRVSWRLIALIAIPLAMGMYFAGIRVSAAASEAITFGRVQQMAVLGQRVSGLAQAMQDESNATVAYIAAGRPAGGLAAVTSGYAATDAWAARVRTLVPILGNSYPAQTRAAAATVLTRISDLPHLRTFATGSHTPALIVVTDYSQATADLFVLEDDIAQEGGNSFLVANVRALGSLSRMKDQAAQQRALIEAALVAGRYAPGQLDAIISAQAQQASDLAAFQASATPSQQETFNDTVAGNLVDQARALEQRAILAGSSGAPVAANTASTWESDQSYAIGRMRLYETRLAAAIAGQAGTLHLGAEHSAQLTAAIALIVLLGVALAAVVIAGSMVRPLRRLHAGALEVATVRLPGEVQQLSQMGQLGDSAEGLTIEPISVHSTDEIGRVARAFDQVHLEAVRLAAEEARLRGSVSAMVVSLSRRSQSLLERLLRLIDTLELGEDDPDRLANLFRMDHLATRMRRHSENMLVLAGHETSRRLAGSVPLVDVIRAAISEVEQYDRIAINIQPGITLAGSAVADVVHLLAELIENASTFSARTTQVDVVAHNLGTGGVLISVTDAGMGMTPDQLEHMNWRLEHPPAADVEVSRHMGLFAVSHLAARHGIRVRLQATPAGGLTAQVWFPDALTRQRGEPSLPGGMSLHTLADVSASAMAASFPADADWFRASGWRLPQQEEYADSQVSATEPGSGPVLATGEFWPSAQDDGWRAAAAVLTPSAGGTTPTGLPIRVPGANLVPGSAGGPAARAARQARLAESAEVARSQLAKFQRGSRRARATPAAEPPRDAEAPEDATPASGPEVPDDATLPPDTVQLTGPVT